MIYPDARLLKRIEKALIVFLLFIAVSDVFSQEMDNIPDSTDSTLALDIKTSSVNELRAWCKVLELESEGTETELRTRLLKYYSIDRYEEKERTGTAIVIESAQRTEYMQVEKDSDKKETVVRFSGGVVISINEKERGRVHRIEADTIVFNKEQKTITASGHIKYVVDTNGRKESFSGDSLKFEVNGWSGVIFNGSAERHQEVEGSDVSFYFIGSSIQRPSTDMLILSKGTITSDNSENPAYALKAKKIWITGPGEWALLSATIYVGNVPLFYIPFYWKSGSEFIFNPVLGYRRRVGYYLQSTTYFIGKKEEDDSFSILGFGDSAGSNYKLTRNGLYLEKKPQEGKVTVKQVNTLKYILDAYTSLGAVTGLVGDFPEIGETGSLNFYATLGVSRSVDENGNPYFNDGNSTETHWNSSYLGKTVLPFRWGTTLDFLLSDWSISLNWFSDPYYLRDFGNRKENFSWMDLLFSRGNTVDDDRNLVPDMKWEINGSHRFDISDTGPWLNSISLDRFRTSLIWSNKPNQDIVNSSNPDKNYDPARNFYYPDKLVLPDIKVSLSGGSPEWNVKKKTADKLIEEKPGMEPDNNSAEEKPDYLGSFNEIYNNNLVRASFKYKVDAQLLIDDRALSENWNSPSDIDFVFDAARINTTQNGTLSYNIDFLDGVSGFSGNTNLLGYYQIHSNIFGDNAVISDSVKTEDLKYSKFLWDNSFNFYIKPFHNIRTLANTAVNYYFNGNIYNRTYDSDSSPDSPRYDDIWINGADNIRQNELSVIAKWTPWLLDFSVDSRVVLPPLDESYSFNNSAGFKHSGWDIRLTQKTDYNKTKWKYNPLSMHMSWSGLKNELIISGNSVFDLEKSRISNTGFSLLLWGFKTDFSLNYGKIYTWDSNSYTWKDSGEGLVPGNLNFSYKRDLNIHPFWKNRIRTKSIFDIGWNINLNQPTENVFSIKWTQEFKIYKFLDLVFSYSMANKSMYLYFPWWRDELGITRKYNFFTDMFNSFNFANTQARRNSMFNMDKFNFSMIHHLGDWDLTMEYSGWPAIEPGETKYKWKSEFSIFVKWNPIPVINQKIQYKNDELTADTMKK